MLLVTGKADATVTKVYDKNRQSTVQFKQLQFWPS